MEDASSVIANEIALLITLVQLLTLFLRNVDLYHTPNNPYMTKERLLTGLGLMRSYPFETCCGTPILLIYLGV